MATVRVGVTPRLKKGGEWVDGETTWYTVTAWRTLADHLRDSVRKGDPVIVHGRLRTETWAARGGRHRDHAAGRRQPRRTRPDPGDQPLHQGPATRAQRATDADEPGDAEVAGRTADAPDGRAA